jgi:hypothetical protein
MLGPRMGYRWDIEKDTRELLAIGDPFLFRIGLAGLFGRYGADRVRRVIIEEAERTGTVSIATAAGWCQPKPRERYQEEV